MLGAPEVQASLLWLQYLYYYWKEEHTTNLVSCAKKLKKKKKKRKNPFPDQFPNLDV
jgi:hypothetical protein